MAAWQSMGTKGKTRRPSDSQFPGRSDMANGGRANGPSAIRLLEGTSPSPPLLGQHPRQSRLWGRTRLGVADQSAMAATRPPRGLPTTLGIPHRHGPDLVPQPAQPLLHKQDISGPPPPRPRAAASPYHCAIHPHEQILPGGRGRDILRTAAVLTSVP